MTYAATCLRLASIGFAVVGTVLVAHPASAAELGRIFFNPGERTALEATRHVAPKPREIAPKPVPVVAAREVEPPPAPPPPVTLNGYVVSSNGRSTAWINNAPKYDAYRIGDNNQIAVPTGDGNRRVPLKVGQTFATEAGVRDNVGAKAVTVRK